ncbi:hypothetical protein KFK09_027967 [Dendrobium nobile]|uniref:Uncharacterized protein n=1 Tax=Dendrobium nobile TaxID=94219 RepID=A0A8T3A273_DENNO|nr:hypothetical protein KFK09_027967 [Dendrobium nobile]
MLQKHVEKRMELFKLLTVIPFQVLIYKILLLFFPDCIPRIALPSIDKDLMFIYIMILGKGIRLGDPLLFDLFIIA